MELATERLTKSNLSKPSGYLYCPTCGELSLEVYLNSPWFFRCESCEETIFMTKKEIFDDMNKELEETYKKEKKEAIEEAIRRHKR